MWYLLYIGAIIQLGSAAVLWECNNWVASDILGGCAWGTTNIHWGEENIAVVSDPTGGSSQNALRIFYAQGSYPNNPGGDRGGTQWLGRPFNGVDEATLEYEIMFDPNYDFVKGGKIPGFFGGTGSCSGGGDDKTCFSSRFMWRTNGDGEIYGYVPNETDDWFCSNPDVHCNFDFGHSFGRGSFRFSRGVWHKLAQYVKLNTPGQSNGVFRTIFDGRQVYEISGLTFRTDNSIKIDGVYFSTFFGGSTADWGAGRDCYTYYRNFIVSN